MILFYFSKQRSIRYIWHLERIMWCENIDAQKAYCFWICSYHSFYRFDGVSSHSTDKWPKGKFQGVVLTFVVVVNIFTTVFQGSVFGVVGKFPPKYMGATMIGQCVGGLIPAIYVILMALPEEMNPKNEGFFGFVIATLCFLIRYKLLNLTWYYIV